MLFYPARLSSINTHTSRLRLLSRAIEWYYERLVPGGSSDTLEAQPRTDASSLATNTLVASQAADRLIAKPSIRLMLVPYLYLIICPYTEKGEPYKKAALKRELKSES